MAAGVVEVLMLRRGVDRALVAARAYRIHLLALLSSVVILGLFSSPAIYAWTRESLPPAAPPWHADGLAGVTVHFFAFGHRNADLQFAATEQGVYRRDADHPWTRVLPTTSVWAIALAPDGRTVVAGSEDGYVSQSADGGLHWRRHLVTPDGVYAASYQPDNPAHVLVGAAGGIFLSLNGGRTWQRRLSLPQSAGTAFAWQGRSSSVVYAGAVAGGAGGSTSVYVSRDAGRTWHVFGRNLRSTGGIMSLAVMPDGAVIAGTMGSAAWTVPRQGGSWRQIATGMPRTNDHVAAIARVPGVRDDLFVATLGQGVYRSRDGGGHWAPFASGLPGEPDSRIVLSLAFDAAHHLLYAGTVNGVYVASISPSVSAWTRAAR